MSFLRLLLMLTIGALSSCASVDTQYHRPATRQQIAEITPLVRARHSGNIDGMTQEPDGTIIVWMDPLGLIYIVGKVGGHWKILREDLATVDPAI